MIIAKAIMALQQKSFIESNTSMLIDDKLLDNKRNIPIGKILTGNCKIPLNNAIKIDSVDKTIVRLLAPSAATAIPTKMEIARICMTFPLAKASKGFLGNSVVKKSVKLKLCRVFNGSVTDKTAIDFCMSRKIIFATNSDSATPRLGFRIALQVIPITLATIKAAINTKTTLRIFIFFVSPESNLIILDVTEEKIIGMADIDIKVKKISLKGFKNSPVLGNINPTTTAHNAANSVVYPFPNIAIILLIFSSPLFLSTSKLRSMYKSNFVTYSSLL
jgi:hypothetical protein